MRLLASKTLVLVLVLAALAGCESPPPNMPGRDSGPSSTPDASADSGAILPDLGPTPADTGPGDSGALDTGTADLGPGSDSGTDSGTPGDAGLPDAGSDAGPACTTAADDYTPRVSNSSTDTWPACISDAMPDDYQRINASISTIARVEAYERLFAPTFGTPAAPGLIFWSGATAPTSANFTDGKVLYDDAQSLGSRVVRRYDEHVPRPATNNDCTMTASVIANPTYCVGPATLSPIVQSAFASGIAGGSEPARVYAARIQAALDFMLFISAYKESASCSATIADCDSAYAYYAGGTNRSGGIGIARLVSALDRPTHDRIWDGILAVRCWRGLDSAATATMPALQMRAQAQFDRALDRGLALVVISALSRLASSTGEQQLAEYAYVRTLLARVPAQMIPNGGTMATIPERESLVDRTIRARSTTDADYIQTNVTGSTTAAQVDVAGITARLRALFPCP